MQPYKSQPTELASVVRLPQVPKALAALGYESPTYPQIYYAAVANKFPAFQNRTGHWYVRQESLHRAANAVNLSHTSDQQPARPVVAPDQDMEMWTRDRMVEWVHAQGDTPENRGAWYHMENAFLKPACAESNNGVDHISLPIVRTPNNELWEARAFRDLFAESAGYWQSVHNPNSKNYHESVTAGHRALAFYGPLIAEKSSERLRRAGLAA